MQKAFGETSTTDEVCRGKSQASTFSLQGVSSGLGVETARFGVAAQAGAQVVGAARDLKKRLLPPMK